MLEPITERQKQLGFRFGLLLDASKAHSRSFSIGLLFEHGLIGVVEASDFESADQFSTFLKAIPDRPFGNEKSAELKQHFTRYVELSRCVRLVVTSSFWKEGDLMKLQDSFVRFKALGKSVLGEYQRSGMYTKKLNLLDYFVDVIRHVGAIQFLHRGIGKIS